MKQFADNNTLTYTLMHTNVSKNNISNMSSLEIYDGNLPVSNDALTLISSRAKPTFMTNFIVDIINMPLHMINKQIIDLESSINHNAAILDKNAKSNTFIANKNIKFNIGNSFKYFYDINLFLKSNMSITK